MLHIRPHVAQDQTLTVCILNDIVKLESLSPHEQEADDVAKVQFLRFGRAVEPVEALDEHIVIDRHAALGVARGRDPAHPMAKRTSRRSAPRFQAEFRPDEFAAIHG
jgi:hypothetical protein